MGVDCASNSPANFRARGTTRSCVDADFTTGGRRLSATHREGARDRPRTMQCLELSSRARQDGAAREHAADAEAIAARIIARRDAAAGRDARSREAAVRIAAAEAPQASACSRSTMNLPGSFFLWPLRHEGRDELAELDRLDRLHRVPLGALHHHLLLDARYASSTSRLVLFESSRRGAAFAARRERRERAGRGRARRRRAAARGVTHVLRPHICTPPWVVCGVRTEKGLCFRPCN